MELYPHQPEAVEFLAGRTEALLADEQGLGKTIVAIRAAARVDSIATLCVVPSVVAHNWRKEFTRWVGMPKNRIQILRTKGDTIDPEARVVICSHYLLTAHQHALGAIYWDVVIVDEAHRFKNPESQWTQALYGAVVAHARSVWLLSGTITPNDPSELWTHLRALWPRLILDGDEPMGFDQFQRHYCAGYQRPINKHETRFKVTGANPNTIGLLRGILSKISLRRTTAQVLPQMPPIRYETITLRPEELSPYLGPWPEVPTNGDVWEYLNGAHMMTARRLVGLAKVDPVVELLRAELEADPAMKVVLFAQHTEVLLGLVDGLVEFGPTMIDGSVPSAARAHMVEAFQTDPECRVFVGQLQAAGVGITLTAASEMVLVESAWSPGENAQAAKRLHRIGQTKPVRVRFVALADTPDETVTDIVRTKTATLQELNK